MLVYRAYVDVSCSILRQDKASRAVVSGLGEQVVMGRPIDRALTGAVRGRHGRASEPARRRRLPRGDEVERVVRLRVQQRPTVGRADARQGQVVDATLLKPL